MSSYCYRSLINIQFVNKKNSPISNVVFRGVPLPSGTHSSVREASRESANMIERDWTRLNFTRSWTRLNFRSKRDWTLSRREMRWDRYRDRERRRRKHSKKVEVLDHLWEWFGVNDLERKNMHSVPNRGSAAEKAAAGGQGGFRFYFRARFALEITAMSPPSSSRVRFVFWQGSLRLFPA